MAAGWTIETLKEHFEKILSERDKALSAALISSDKRLDLLNELRAGVATKDELKALEKVVDDLRTSRDRGEGKTTGYAQFIGWIIAAISVIGFVITTMGKSGQSEGKNIVSGDKVEVKK